MTAWVLLRGLAREAGHWGDFPALLAAADAGAPVVAVDLPGAGTLHHQRCPWHVAAMVDACRAQLAGRGIAPPYRLLGLSLGGMVAAAWGLQSPDEVAGLALVNTSLRPFGGPLERLRPANLPGLLRALLSHDDVAAERAVLRMTSHDPAAHAGAALQWAALRRARRVSAANVLRQLTAAARFRHDGPAPKVPTLVIAGAGDRLVSPVCSQRLARQWQAPLRLHATAGHDLPLDAGPWLAGELARWWAQPSQAAGAAYSADGRTSLARSSGEAL